MTTQAERIEQRERHGIAWAIRDMILTASRDETPSAAAAAMLATVRDQASGAARKQITARGFAAFTTVLPDSDRQAIFEALRSASERMADQVIEEIGAQQAGNRGRGTSGRFALTELPARALRLSTGFLGRFSSAPTESQKTASIEPTV